MGAAGTVVGPAAPGMSGRNVPGNAGDKPSGIVWIPDAPNEGGGRDWDVAPTGSPFHLPSPLMPRLLLALGVTALLALPALLAAPARAQSPFECIPDLNTPLPLRAAPEAARAADPLAPRPPAELAPEDAAPGARSAASDCALTVQYRYWTGADWATNSDDVAAYTSSGLPSDIVSRFNIGTPSLSTDRRTYTYEDAGRRLRQDTYSGLTSFGPRSDRSTYSYGTAPNATWTRITERIAGTTWALAFHESYTYTRTNQAVYLSQSWTGSDWLTNYRYTYDFDHLGRVVFDTEEVRAGSVLTPRSRILYSYNSGGGVDRRRSQSYDASGAWVTTRGRDYTYDGAGRLAETLFLTGALLTPERRTRSTYGAAGGLAETLTEQWVPAGSIWQSTGRTLFTRDGSGRTLEERFQNADGSGGWANRESVVYTYRATTAGEADPAAAALALSVGPNPAGRSATLRFTLAAPADVRLTITDALGREVAVVAQGERAAGAHTAAVDVSRLAPGVYVARLAAGAAVATRRLSVVR